MKGRVTQAGESFPLGGINEGKGNASGRIAPVLRIVDYKKGNANSMTYHF
ncbi:hypothetical protein V7112_06160 [Bacillus sp. JJ1566]